MKNDYKPIKPMKEVLISFVNCGGSFYGISRRKSCTVVAQEIV